MITYYKCKKCGHHGVQCYTYCPKCGSEWIKYEMEV